MVETAVSSRSFARRNADLVGKSEEEGSGIEESATRKTNRLNLLAITRVIQAIVVGGTIDCFWKSHHRVEKGIFCLLHPRTSVVLSVEPSVPK